MEHQPIDRKRNGAEPSPPPHEEWIPKYEVIKAAPAPFLSKAKKRITSLESYISHVTSILLKVSLWFLLIFILVILWREFQKDHYTIQTFQVPKALEEEGYNGKVVAQQIYDRIANIGWNSRSVRESREYNSTSTSADAFDVEIIGVGLSLQTLVNQLRQTFGRPNNFISGEIVQVDSSLILTLRIPNYKSQEIKVSTKKQSKSEAMEDLMELSAEYIVLQTQPYVLAVYQEHFRDYEGCLETIQRMIRESPEERVWAYNLWGNVLIELDSSPALILQKYHRALEIDPTFSLAHSNVGLVHLQEEQYEEAIEAFEKGLEINRFDNFNTIYRNYGRALFALGKEKEALEKFEQSIQTGNDGGNAYTHKLLGDLYLEKGDIDKSIDYYEKCLEIRPYYRQALIDYGIILSEHGKFDRSFQIHHRLIDMNPKSLNGLNGMAYTYLLMGNGSNANRYLQQSMQIDSTIGTTYAMLSGVRALEGDYRASFEFMDRALFYNFELEEFMDNPIVAQMQQHPRFIQLMKKYGKEMKD